MDNVVQNISNNKFIDKKEDNYFNSLPKETFSRNENNSDVINLSELSKIKLEYERDDVKMNNGQFNNEMNNNFGQPDLNQGPTFGGRFFPSLEDEPTNMNMMGGLNNGPVAPTMPPMTEPAGVTATPNMNNNLIDLTDLSADNEQMTPPMPNFGSQQPNIPTMEPQMNIPGIDPMLNNNFNQPTNNNFEMPNIGVNPIPANDSIINLENLQNNNPSVTPMSEPVSMDILNADFGAPQPMQNPSMPTPTVDLNIPQTQGFVDIPTPNFGINQQPMMGTQQPMPSFNINQNQQMQPTFENPMSIPNIDNNISMPNTEINSISTKDVTPVTNTIKNLVNSLTGFGYKINITEEDLMNMTKVIIEVEK